MTRKNPNSPIRKGYQYEDLFLLKLCVEWLKQPNIFEYIRIQYIPSTITYAKFAIEDIVTVSPSGEHQFFQIKHKQHPRKDCFDFEELFNKGLLRWITSYHAANHLQNYSASLFTNGIPDEAISICLVNEKIQLDQLHKTQPAIYDKLLDSFSHSQLSLFFENFNFIFHQPSTEELEQQLRKLFYRELHVTEAGVNRLLLFIQNYGTSPHPPALTLDIIRRQLLWDNPRPLNQNFQVPEDFEFYDKKGHEDLLLNLSDASGGIHVITGKPGAGKSTYLSKLYDVLNHAEKYLVVRHHYHLNPKDSSYRERLNADRVTEALRAEFKKYDEEVIGDLHYRDTAHISLQTFIERTAAWCISRGKTFILIIDGLDHVIREGKNAEQLTGFLDEVLYPQAGYHLLLGTQEMTIPYFPSEIYDHAPQQHWIEIKGLNREAGINLINKHAAEIHLHPNEAFSIPIVHTIYSKSAGNPLHLRYLLAQLTNNGGIHNQEEIDHLPAYENEIATYYSHLWRKLTSLSKHICFCISQLDFKLQQTELLDLCTVLSSHIHEIDDSYIAIRHLIKDDLTGISVFHNSFLVFLIDQPELVQQKHSLLKKVSKWIQQSGPKELKWGELLKIEFELGNYQPLLSLNREWVIKSFLSSKEDEKVEEILSLATLAAFRRRDFKKTILYRSLSVYYHNKQYNLFETADEIWINALRLNKNETLRYPNFNELSHLQIKAVLFVLKKQGIITDIPEDIPYRINDLMHHGPSEREDIFNTWLDIAAHFDAIDIEDLPDLIGRNHEGGPHPGRYAHYTRQLLIHHAHEDIRLLLGLQLDPEERTAITHELALHDMRSAASIWLEDIKKEPLKNRNALLTSVYLRIQHVEEGAPAKLSPYNAFPESFDSRSSAQDIYPLYRKNIFCAIHLALAGNLDDVYSWIEKGPEQYQIQLMIAGVTAITQIIQNYKERKRNTLGSLLSCFSNLPELDYGLNTTTYELQRAVLPNLMVLVIELQTLFNQVAKFDASLTASECEQLLNLKWIERAELNELIKEGKIVLSRESLKVYFENAHSKISTEYIHFRDKAAIFASLASFAIELSDIETAHKANAIAAEYAVSYGYHKDITIWHCLDSIEIIGKKAPLKAREMLRSLAPYIYRITELTDGDETRHFIYTFANLLAIYDTNLLMNLHLDAIGNRNYALRESTFANIIETLPIKTPLGRAIALTAIDEEAFHTLQRKAQKNTHFKKVYEELSRHVGSLEYTLDSPHSDYSGRRKTQKDDFDYSTISPQLLKAHLTSISKLGYYGSRKEKSDFIIQWSTYWFSPKATATPKEVAETLKRIFDNNYFSFSDDMYDHIYPHIYKVDKSFAFECISWAQARGHSWSGPPISNMNEGRDRWLKVKRDFPDAKDEFFIKSITYGGREHAGDRDGAFIPGAKAAQYFIDFNDIETAVRITEYHIDLLYILFPQLDLPTPAFIADEIKVDLFDILLHRFTDMSPLVRERAATGLANLLAQDNTGQNHNKFLAWLCSQELTIHVCNGLAVLLHSLDKENSKSNRYLKLNKLANKLAVRTFPTDTLLYKLAKKTGQLFHFQEPLYIAYGFARPSITREKFLANLSYHLPPSFSDFLEQIENDPKDPLWPIWHRMFDEWCKKYNLRETWDDKFHNNRSHDTMPGRSTIFTDILRSTYFSFLDALMDMDRLTYFLYRKETQRNMQVDDTIWNIPMSAKPAWWPQYEPLQERDNRRHQPNTVTPNYVKAIETMINCEVNSTILYAAGATTAAENHYEDSITGSFQLIPFMFKSKSRLPDATTLYKQFKIQLKLYFSRPLEQSDYGRFDGELHYKEKELPACKAEALTAMIYSYVPHMWQYYRFVYPMHLLIPELKGALQLKADKNGLRYTSEGKNLANIFEFTDGLRDKFPSQSIIPSGSYLHIDTEYLQQFLETNSRQLGFIIRETHHVKKDSYKDGFIKMDSYRYFFP